MPFINKEQRSRRQPYVTGHYTFGRIVQLIDNIARQCEEDGYQGIG